MGERSGAALGLALILVAACGARSGGAASCGADAASEARSDGMSAVDDGGSDIGDRRRDFPDGPITGLRSFDMTATVLSGGALTGTRATFTLVLDPAAQVAYVGRSLSHFTSVDGTSFRIDPFIIGDLPSDLGSATGPLQLGIAALTYADGVLSGTVQASQLELLDQALLFQMSLVGTPDDTPPTFAIYPDTRAIDPFIGLLFSFSEPLPPSSAIRLEGGLAGATFSFDLVPYFVSDPMLLPGLPPVSPPGAIFAFGKPDVVLTYGASYKLGADRVTDFAGLLLAANEKGSAFVTTTLRPPLIPPDGFESAPVEPLTTGGVVDASWFPILAGAHSLYVTQREILSRPCSTQQRSLATLRLTVPPGAQSVRFSYRAVSTISTETGRPSVAVGSEAGSISRADLIGTLVPTLVAAPDGRQWYFGQPRTFEVSLPADVGPEVLVDFEDLVEGCGLPRSPTGLLVDDLRVE